VGTKPRGFTIVKLLIVIIVIGILVATTIVTFNGEFIAHCFAACKTIKTRGLMKTP
jgi:Tfp pilus assembly protein PilE